MVNTNSVKSALAQIVTVQSTDICQYCSDKHPKLAIGLGKGDTKSASITPLIFLCPLILYSLYHFRLFSHCKNSLKPLSFVMQV